MLASPWTMRSAAWLLPGLAALALLYLAEQRMPQLGVWLFIVLSLTVGMGHGALDTALLLGQFKPATKALAYAALYLLLVILAAWLLSMSLAWALLILLAMSVWHFGEIYAPYTALRLAVGGASVMAPMLLHSEAMQALLPVLVGNDAAWVAAAWRILAWLWVAGALIALLWRMSGSVQSGELQQRACMEIVIVMVLFAVLSPLLAFALYFGLYHCTSHILRVRRAVARHHGFTHSRLAWVWAASSVLTAVLLALLWHYLPGSMALSGNLSAQLLPWLVVALGAVTVPHLLLVGYSGRWLGR
jgi:beta-carotene 15,15'-dioxygenase